MSSDTRYSPPSVTVPATVSLMSGSAGSAGLPAWYRESLVNEYRALMMRAQYLRGVLGIARGGE